MYVCVCVCVYFSTDTCFTVTITVLILKLNLLYYFFYKLIFESFCCIVLEKFNGKFTPSIQVLSSTPFPIFNHSYKSFLIGLLVLSI